MRTNGNRTLSDFVLVALCALFAMPGLARACPDRDELLGKMACMDDGDAGAKKKAKPKKSSKDDKSAKKKHPLREDGSSHIRWGQRRTESDEAYDKRYAALLKRIKQDKKGDFTGGSFTNGKEQVYLWTYMGHPFIVRTDISKEFTADTAMYMEMLHRDYGNAYKKFLGVPAQIKQPIEVIVFADRATYMRNGGAPGSGGMFQPAAHLMQDRLDAWPARHFRLSQFTDGETDFAKWEKGTLKHEAAHMELQMRLGMTLLPGYNIGFPVRAPNWWNEGHASVFEWWDFDKDVDENLLEVPDRGRYAPIIRRLFGTDGWKNFDYVWKIDPASWHRDMTTPQGYLNYCQSWSLAAYMMSSGVEGRNHFRAIFDLSKRVGVDRQTTYQGDTMLAWQDKFPIEEQEKLEKQWMKWVETHVSRDKKVPDEEYFLRRGGFNPKVLDRLERFSSEEDFEANRKWVKAEEKRRAKLKLIEK
ncbi:MAG: hypothetical protein KF841_04075 [Phycisphaerae bacterium]|nr:hypothetical protein [Phycisphaerae bacterium]